MEKNKLLLPHIRASRYLFARFLLVFTFFSFTLLAQIPDKPNPERLVNDFAAMLTPQEVEALEAKLVALDDSTGNQIAIVTVPNLGGDDVANYGNQLFRKWAIGHKDKNNGVLILLSAEEHKSHIEVGYGLEGAIPDVICKRLLQDEMKPLFKQGKFYEGLDVGSTILSKLASGEYKASDYGGGNKKMGKRGPAKPLSPMQIIFGIIFFIIAIVVISKNPWLLLLLMNSGGRRGGGFGDFSGGRGDFGGFGGGSSGGGGASGDW